MRRRKDFSFHSPWTRTPRPQVEDIAVQEAPRRDPVDIVAGTGAADQETQTTRQRGEERESAKDH